MEQTVFNPAQMRILHMMSFIKTPQQLDNLENAISQYFAPKADAGLDALCNSGKITLDTIEEWGKKKQVALNNVKNKLIHLVTAMVRNRQLFSPEYKISA